MIPKLKMTPQGIEAPSLQEIIAGAWSMMEGAFGPDLNKDMRTPQGQLVTSISAFVNDNYGQQINFFNQADPRYAQDKMQDAIAQIYFIKRKDGVNSVAQLTATGVAGTSIPSGYYFIDDNDVRWVATDGGTITADGSGSFQVQCVESGPVRASPNSITTIPTAIDGLDRVTNPLEAVAGIGQENRVDFEARRYESVAINSKNTNPSVQAAVNNLPNVLDVFVIDNPTDETITVGSTNYPMIRNSLLVSVVGGDGQSIARQILAKGGTGCSFVGNTEIDYWDTENYEDRPPLYNIKFLRPEFKNVYFKITIPDIRSLNIGAEQELKDSIQKAFTQGKSRVRINSRLIASSFICGIAIPVISIKVSTDNVAWHDYIDFGVDEYPVINKVNISIEGLL